MVLILESNYKINTHIMGVFFNLKKKFQILTSIKKQVIKYLYLQNQIYYARLCRYCK